MYAKQCKSSMQYRIHFNLYIPTATHYHCSIRLNFGSHSLFLNTFELMAFHPNNSYNASFCVHSVRVCLEIEWVLCKQIVEFEWIHLKFLDFELCWCRSVFSLFLFNTHTHIHPCTRAFSYTYRKKFIPWKLFTFKYRPFNDNTNETNSIVENRIYYKRMFQFFKWWACPRTNNPTDSTNLSELRERQKKISWIFVYTHSLAFSFSLTNKYFTSISSRSMITCKHTLLFIKSQLDRIYCSRG